MAETHWDSKPPTWIAQLFEQHAQIRQEVTALREAITQLREQEAEEHGKINSVLAAMDSTPTTPGISERLRRLENIVENLKSNIDELEESRAADLESQAALGKRVHLTLVALLVAVAGTFLPQVAKLLQ